MRKTAIIISLIFFLTSCFIRRERRIDGLCRPKNPNFKLAKISFKETDKIVFNKIYIIETIPMSIGYGFYPNGRIIFVHSKDGFALKSEDVLNNTWNNAPAIGYWRIEENRITTEYFSCSNSGDYIEEQGEIRSDTIFFERDCGTSPSNKKKCYDKYVLSNMSFE